MIPTKHNIFFVIILVLSLYEVYCDEKSSLTFVIDDTYSMSNDIRQVKEAADAIFDTVLMSNESQIEDFVLVTFNDPGTVLRTVTKDRDEFKAALSSISVYGGGDCPEYSMKGITDGIVNSKFGSTIYVFTDAAAKDYLQYDDVKNMAIKKQIQVVFVLTGICDGSKNSPDYLVYHNLATDTGGEVFHIYKQEIKDILEAVKENLKGRRTTIASATFPPGKHSLNITNDGTTKGTVVSATGHKPTLEISKSDGSKPDTKTLFHNDNSNIVKVIEEPKPAEVFNIEVGSDSETHVVVSAITEVKFKHGFSTFKPSSINETTITPLPDVKSHITIQLTDGNIKLKTVKIHDMHNKLIKEIPLVALNETEKLYTTNLEDLPSTMFKIGITGYNPDSNTNITRFGPPITPQPRPTGVTNKAPKVSILGSPTLKTKFDEPLQLKCKVNGYPKPNIVWVNVDTGEEMTAEIFTVEIPDDFISILNIDRFKNKTNYQCRATNSMGSDYSTILVEATAVPFFNVTEEPRDTTISYHDKGELHCKVDAYPPATVTWYKDGRLLLESDSVEFGNDNSVVKITEMHSSDDGNYVCEMRNENQRQIRMAKITLIGIDAPVINDAIKAVEIPSGLDAVITCDIIQGNPKPTITWYYDFDSEETETLTEWNNQTVITIRNVDKNNSGIYTCEAINEIGSDIHEVKLTVEYPPEVKNDVEKVRVAEGDSVTMPCYVEGEPDPVVTWYKNGIPVTKSNKFYIYRDHTIRIIVTKEDSGTYTCNATNKLGTASRTVQVDVYVPITITLPKESKMDVNVGSTLNLPCKAHGHPPPNTEWTYYSFDPSIPPKPLLKSNGSSDIKLKDMRIEDEGYYTCTASNLEDSTNVTYEIHVLAPPMIENIYLDKQFRAVEGDLVAIIKCNASGNPPPTIRWLKNGYWVAEGDDFTIENGTFIMKNITKDAEGVYVCEAKNILGFDRDVYQVTVDKSPQPGYPTSTIIIGEDSSVAVTCDVPHKRTDLLRWYKNGVLIKTGELIIRDAKVSDSGLYTCRVSDFVKSTTGNTMVKVGIKPRFVTDEKENIEFAEDSPYVLSCEATGDPKPKLTWWHNGEIMNTTESYHYFEMEVGTHGRYDCEAINEFGSITRSFNIIPKDCLIDLSKHSSKLQPLITSSKLHWPQNTIKNGFMSIAQGEYVILLCPSRFKTLPQPYNFAFCEGGTKFKIQGQLYEYSNIECTEKVTHLVERTGESCFTENTEFFRVVFKTPSEPIEAYEICVDLDNNIPLYTTIRMRNTVADLGYLGTKWADEDIIDWNIDDAYDCNRQISTISSVLGRSFHRDDGCCFGKRMLVNPKDLFPGVAQSAAYSYLNVVPHWSTCNAKSSNWNEVEQRVRSLAKSSYSELVVSTGVAEDLTLPDIYRTEKDIYIMDGKSNRQFVPLYLWKVVQDPDTKSSLVIIQVNVPDLLKSEAAAYVRCRDICNTTKWMKGSTWYDVNRGFTYCCTLKDFEDNFGFNDVFLPYYPVLNDVSLISEHSMT